MDEGGAVFEHPATIKQLVEVKKSESLVSVTFYTLLLVAFFHQSCDSQLPDTCGRNA